MPVKPPAFRLLLALLEVWVPHPEGHAMTDRAAMTCEVCGWAFDSYGKCDCFGRSSSNRAANDVEASGTWTNPETGRDVRIDETLHVPDATRNSAATANPYNEAEHAEALRREYERGRKDGYDETVKMIRRATDALRKEQKR